MPASPTMTSPRWSGSGSRSSAGRDHLDLDAVVRRKRRDPDGRTGRWFGREVLAVHAVHRGELGEVLQVDRCLDDVLVVEADRVQEASDVVEHRAGLGLDATGDGALDPGRTTDLAGDEDEAIGLDHLGERELARLETGA